MVKADDWRRAIFGYTSMIDVSAREQGRRTWPATPLTSWLGKSFDTFAPIGPCITTADEIDDPNDLLVRFWTMDSCATTTTPTTWSTAFPHWSSSPRPS